MSKMPINCKPLKWVPSNVTDKVVATNGSMVPNKLADDGFRPARLMTYSAYGINVPNKTIAIQPMKISTGLMPHLVL